MECSVIKPQSPDLAYVAYVASASVTLAPVTATACDDSIVACSRDSFSFWASAAGKAISRHAYPTDGRHNTWCR